MIDYFTLALTHGLIAVALWRLMFRPELDAETPRARAKAQAGAEPGADDA